MNPRARTVTTAWLGLLAMWLIVLAPLVSQLVAARRAPEPETTLCSTAQSGVGSHHGMQDGAFSACGYCDLLATHAAVPPVPAVTLPLITLIVVALVRLPVVRFTPLGAFPSGRPRAPPLAS